jgi:hypothetical protein
MIFGNGPSDFIKNMKYFSLPNYVCGDAQNTSG